VRNIVDAPALYLGFASLHLVAGHFLSALAYRRRFGKSPLVLYRAGPENLHRRLTRAIAVVAAIWGASLVAFALSSHFRASWPGRPLFVLHPIAGWVLAALGLVGMVGSQLAMGRAFAVGQDEQGAAPELQTAGPFRWSRNPIYLCSFLYLAGMTLWAPCALLVTACTALGALMHGLVVAEERYLSERLGDEYRAYRRRVRRYL